MPCIKIPGPRDGDPHRFDSSGLRENPLSLQNICLNFVCDNIVSVSRLIQGAWEPCQCGFKVTTSAKKGDVAMGHIETKDDAHVPSQKKDEGIHKVKKILRFVPLGQVYIPEVVSEQLLERFCTRESMNEEVLSLFNENDTRLQNVRISYAHHIGLEGLKTFHGHKITEFEIHDLNRVAVPDLFDHAFNDWTLRHLKTLIVSSCSFKTATQKYSDITHGFSKLIHLTTLSVAFSIFDTNALNQVVEHCQRIEHLDLSGTRVTDISSLHGLKNRLKWLSLHGLALDGQDIETVELLKTLDKLVHLDISLKKNIHPLNSILNRSSHSFSAEGLLQCDGKSSSVHFPDLVSLDLSGRLEIQEKEPRICQDGGRIHDPLPFLLNFIDCHPKLQYIGLAFTNACEAAIFMEEPKLNPEVDVNGRNSCLTSREERGGCWPSLKVGGTGNRVQAMEMLRRYPDRSQYIQKAFYHLFKFSQNFEAPKIELIQMIIAYADHYSSTLTIQLAATACLFNLSKGHFSDSLHPRILSDIVRVDLNAMESFQNHQQLQKNVLLTLCNDKFLHSVNFDRYRCARQVMNCLVGYRDPSMNRMSVAICSILAGKITTSETTMLGSEKPYMHRLLSIVKTRTESKELDMTLRFTLSALWNLTDESPKTCAVFLNEGGMDIFMEVLLTFCDELIVESKVLGLLNNIAEVEELRQRLVTDPFLTMLSKKLMYSNHIEVSYFACGIAAYLTSNGSTDWTAVTSISKEDLIDELATIVSQWPVPKGEMVAYRSFAPFFPLLSFDQNYAAQLWASWGVHHVCSKSHLKYCPKLVEEGGIKILLRLNTRHHMAWQIPQGSPLRKRVHEMIVSLCEEVVSIAEHNKYLTQQQSLDLRQEVKYEFQPEFQPMI